MHFYSTKDYYFIRSFLPCLHQIKLTEMCKSIHMPDYPITAPRQGVVMDKIATRACTTNRLIEPGQKK